MVDKRFFCEWLIRLIGCIRMVDSDFHKWLMIVLFTRDCWWFLIGMVLGWLVIWFSRNDRLILSEGLMIFNGVVWLIDVRLSLEWLDGLIFLEWLVDLIFLYWLMTDFIFSEWYVMTFYFAQEMQEAGLEANTVVYNSALDACGRAGKPKVAAKLLRKMSEAGERPSVDCI